jgi:DNA replication protein DnaC
VENTEETTKTVFSILIEKLTAVVDAFGQVQTAWGLIVAITLFFLFVIAIFLFRMKVNNRSKAQIKSFIKMKKYEPALYIELNRNMEYLRHFIFAHKWKKRIVSKYNKLFSGYDGKRLMESLEGECTGKISSFAKMSDIYQQINSLNAFFETLRSERDSHRKKLGEYFFILRNLAYYYSKVTDDLRKCCDMAAKKSILLVGSAGNGKTNLMCRISEIAIKNKIPVMLINSRDVDEDCKDYILNNLPIPKKLKWLSSVYLYVISFLLMLRRKNFYIIIDAINENDREIFAKSLGKMVDYFSKYPRVRIALTCRSEYFESRYKNYFEECVSPPHIVDIMSIRYTDRASMKMLEIYREHFNVGGKISFNAQKKLLKSLLLMRIFFEVNADHDESIVELRNANVYYTYLERMNSEIKTINFIDIVYKVAGAMIEDAEYNYVTTERINISGEEKEKLFRVLDDNIIISRTVVTGQGITKNEDEVISFVFDEFRDFCLARFLLLYSERAHDSEYDFFFAKASQMFQMRQSPIEGVIKYAYFHFKSNGHFELSNKILHLYGETDVQRIVDDADWHNRKQRNFYNFGLSLIFIDGGEIVESEMAYIKDYIARNPSNYWEVFWFLIANEYSEVSPRMDFGLQLLIECKSFGEISNIVTEFFADRHDYRYSSSNNKRKAAILRDWLEHIEKQNTSLSMSLKQFLVILCAIDPYEFELNEYNEYVLEDVVYNALCESVQCEELVSLIQELRVQKKPQPFDENALRSFLQSLMQGGAPDVD